MMTTLHKFIPATGDWTQCIEKINQFYVAKDIEEKTRNKAILLRLCGAGIYSSIKVTNEHQNPKSSVIVEQYKFDKRDKQLGESIPFL